MSEATPYLVALAGNPNVGKSTVFNALTGLRQHTGNWPGKTVALARGEIRHGGRSFCLVDLPGTYSLLAHSPEEAVAGDFLREAAPDAVIAVCDATCLERNLNLVLQLLEITPRVVICLNLMDEARSRGIEVDLPALQETLGVPVVPSEARVGKGLEALMEQVAAQCEGGAQLPHQAFYPPPIEQAVQALMGESESPSRFTAVRLLCGDEQPSQTLQDVVLTLRRELEGAHGLSPVALQDAVVCSLVRRAEEIAATAVTARRPDPDAFDRRLDALVTNRRTGVPLMIALLALTLWITIWGANLPSDLLMRGLFRFGNQLREALLQINTPAWLMSLLVDGVYRVTAWVVAVMLPPMAIFFPLFTLLEDFGLLPRIAFNLDHHFKRAGACGKQSLTMCLGFGCNAAGVVGCRIIDSPRERLIAILTNNFVPCNGRFPTLIAMISMFFVTGGFLASLRSALMLTALLVLGVLCTLGVSRLLSATLLRGVPSSFTLELPPYRKPQIGQTLLRSLLDRTLFVLARAVSVAAPAGLLLWLLANCRPGGVALLPLLADFLQPLGHLMGLDGVTLLAFILGFPANEIVLPVAMMIYMGSGTLTDIGTLAAFQGLLVSNGWTTLTALCVLLFTLFHWPCSTTCLTIKKETGSVKWTALAMALPTAVGVLMCMLAAAIGRLFL